MQGTINGTEIKPSKYPCQYQTEHPIRHWIETRILHRKPGHHEQWAAPITASSYVFDFTNKKG